MDEQLADQGDTTTMYHPPVGHVPRGVGRVRHLPAVRVRRLPPPLARATHAREGLPRTHDTPAERAHTELDRLQHKRTRS